MADFTSKGESLFSHLHPHPLVLTDSPTSMDCSGCGKSFLESVSYYSCSDGCCFDLHERCAELPRSISHPTHSQHLLTLHKEPPNRCSYFDCDVCGKFWQYFTYYCSLCEFKIDTDCAFIQEWTITNASHDDHDLNLLMKPSLFLCNACGEKREDKSYQCTKCQYWIHYTCALSPVTLDYTDHHDHPLTLAYKLPRSVSDFSPVCIVCDKEVKAPYWFYFCEQDCRYFVHLKCATLNPSDTESNSVTTEEGLQNLMHFPMDNPLEHLQQML